MKIKSKIASLLLTISILSALVIPSSAESGNTLKFSGNKSVKPGQKLDVAIEYDGSQGIWGLNFRVGYNHDVFTLESYTNGDLFQTSEIQVPEYLDNDYFSFEATKQDHTNTNMSGTVVILTFKAKEDALYGDYDITLQKQKNVNYYAVDATGVYVDVAPSNTKLSVSNDIYGAEISWGAMEFTYKGDAWNDKSHKYEGGEWSVDTENGDKISVKNTGNLASHINFDYAKTDANFTGKFKYSETTVSSAINLAVGDTITVNFSIDGTPKNDMLKSVIGCITVRLEE